MSEITECAIHPVHSASECEHCDQEIRQREDRVAEQVRKNTNLSKDLQAEGAGVDPNIWLSLRLDMLIEVILRDGRNRMKFESEYHERVLEILQDASREFAKHKLKASPIDLARVKLRKQ